MSGVDEEMTPASPALPFRLLSERGGHIAWRDEEDLTIGVLYVIKKVARSYGYAVAWHGSLARDLDLIAVPWTAEAAPVETMVAAVKAAIGGEYTPGQDNPSRRAHGRLAYALNLFPTGQYVDLSVMPPVASIADSTAEQVGVACH